MSDTVIKVENLSKKYILSHQSQERYTALRDVMANGVKNLGKRLLSPFNFNRSTPLGTQLSTLSSQPSTEDFYALREVSFEIKQGDRVGIIGRNGAGKSTLLKILSRITEPTSGRIEITGRVASLLEVGTGFHPELTGRENIYLNGAILGMGREEIKRKFDEIVDFAEVEKFLDTPVKRYSSGMYVRLAFAVAAHMEPEILIIDEVLAVGDAQFQKKCLGKMEDVGKQGRTVLFVSHNMAAVHHLCNTGMLLESGNLLVKSSIDIATKAYSSRSELTAQNIVTYDGDVTKPQFKSIKLINDSINYGGQLDIEFLTASPIDIEAGIEIEIRDDKGTSIAYSSTSPMCGYLISIRSNSANSTKLRLGPLNLASGDYYLSFWLIMPWAENYHVSDQSLKFSVELSDPYNSGFDFRQSYSRGSFAVPLTLIQ